MDKTIRMIDVYRHDAHKFHGQSHADAPKEFAGIPVNRAVPYGADADAGALSRPPGRHEPVVPTHEIHHRLSLLIGDPVYIPDSRAQAAVENDVRDLLTVADAESAHECWLHSDVATLFNEAVAFPYTSLKYHTLLVAALSNTYRAGLSFDDLHLVVDPADEIVTHRTVYSGDRFALRIDTHDGSRPSARIGSRPWRSWASTWNRLTAHRLNTDDDKWDMALDANLRRIWAWSTALQYLEDFTRWRGEQ